MRFFRQDILSENLMALPACRKQMPIGTLLMDALDKLIDLAQLNGRIDTCCRIGGGFHLAHLPEPQTARLHWVVSGTGRLKIGDTEHALKPGDAVLLPYDTAHSISDSAQGLLQPPGRPSLSALGALKLEECGGSSLQLLCGCYRYARHASLWLGMPEHLLLPLPELRPIAVMMMQEAGQNEDGGASVIDALSQVLLIGALRRYRQTGGTSLLSQLEDTRLNVLLRALLNAPQDDWDIGKMCQIAHLSRAQLMRLFKQHLGHSPHRFVQSLRLQQAAAQLRSGSDTVLRVSLDNGFASEAHFNRVFKAYFGQTPKQYRKAETQ